MKKQRLRITFSKTAAMRFTGHLDLILTWERTFRRAGLPLAYSEGFSPRPILNMAAPLPLGYTSTGEVGDFWLSEILPIEDVLPALNRSLPPGLIIHQIDEITDLYGFKLPSIIEASVYSLSLKIDYPGLVEKVNKLLESDQVIRERKGKKYDLRPLILAITLESEPETAFKEIRVTLTTQPGATGRPDEILSALGIPRHEASINRTRVNLKSIEELP